MPWQEYAADVIGELDDRGLPRWSTVILSVPRQSGKSSLMAAVAVHRAIIRREGRVWLTAQTGADARDLWLECQERISRSPLAAAFFWRRANGTENLECKLTHATFKPHPPTEEKLHGKQSDLNIIDEAWVFDEAEAKALMQAIDPTQITRPGAQIIIVSTMGTAKSTWFHGLVDQARAGDPNMAILDWGIGPEDDPLDLETVAAHHPALGHTVTMDKLDKARSRMAANPAEFARAYGNRATGAIERLIPEDAWKAALSDEAIPTDAVISFGAAVDIDRTRGAIAAAWHSESDDRIFIEIVESKAGTAWLAPRLRDLDQAHTHAGIIIDRVGPSGALFDELDRSGVEVQAIQSRELTAGTAEFFDRINHSPPKVSIRYDQTLDLAAEIVTSRYLGDAWTWDRKNSGGSIAPLEAATLALIGATHNKLEPMPCVRVFNL